MLLRSKDVLHNFYVPQFRAKMDIVPGLVSYLWFTPTKVGTYEVACAELCGVGHYNMRSQVVVDSDIEYQVWLANQPTFGSTISAAGAEDPMVTKGREVAQKYGCLGCHSVDGAAMLGPTWKGMYGKEEVLADGSTVIVDDEYIIESIINPNAKVVQGYPAVMPAASLSDEEMQAILAFARAGAETHIENEASSQTSNEIPVHTDSAESLIEQGRLLAQQRGCIACHSLDGKNGVGPSWAGLYGSERELADGSSVTADEAYLIKAIQEPNFEVVKGYSPIMPPSGLSDAEVAALVEYMKSGID